jgi:hypothetical protein
LNHAEAENLNQRISEKHLPTRSPILDSFMAEFYQMFKEELTSISLKMFYKKKKKKERKRKGGNSSKFIL